MTTIKEVSDEEFEKIPTVKGYKPTYALRFVVDVSDLIRRLPEDVRHKCHFLLLDKAYKTPVVDIVSDEPLELFGEQLVQTNKGTPLCHALLPIDFGKADKE